MTRSIAVHALVLVSVMACRQQDIVPGVSDSAYVATMSALIRIKQEDEGDSSRLAAARDSVLQGRDLTREDMERAARALEQDPERAMALWERVVANARSDVAAPAPVPQG